MKFYIKLITILSIVACNNKPNSTEQNTKSLESLEVELTDAQVKNSSISTGKLEQHQISSQLKVNGLIEVPPQNMVSISVPMGGYLKNTKLLEGMHISKGEIIAVMEDPQYIELQKNYLTAKAHFSAIESEYLRQKELNLSKASSDKVFEKAQSEYISQKVLIKSLEEQLRLIGINPAKLNETSISRTINIYSPIDGFVSSVKQNIGKYVAPTEVLFELVNPTDIHLAITIFEKDLEKIAIGQKLIAYTNNQPDKKYNCEIILISKTISAERAVVVHCHFDRYDKSLIPGMYMNAEIEVSTNNANVISNDGIVRFEGKEFVFEQTSKNKFKMIEVKTHNSENGYTQISIADGSDFNDKIFVTQGAYTLLMKMKNEEEK